MDEPRTVLVHLNLGVPADDPRGADVVADVVMDALAAGWPDGDRIALVAVSVAMSEEL